MGGDIGEIKLESERELLYKTYAWFLIMYFKFVIVLVVLLKKKRHAYIFTDYYYKTNGDLWHKYLWAICCTTSQFVRSSHSATHHQNNNWPVRKKTFFITFDTRLPTSRRIAHRRLSFLMLRKSKETWSRSRKQKVKNKGDTVSPAPYVVWPCVGVCLCFGGLLYVDL